MSEEIDTAREAFQQAIDPAQSANEQPAQRQPATRARDVDGRFAAVAERASPLFSVRMVEGDPETGDTDDGGDDVRLRERERDIADGRIDERAERERAKTVQRKPDDDGAAADDEHEAADAEQGGTEAEAAGDEESEGPEYEVTVDGQTQHVSLEEMRDGYIRTATFHARLNKTNELRAKVDQENARVGQLRDLYINGLSYLDQDIQAMSPPEPDWDAEYAQDPLAARRKQKQFQEVQNKLNQIRANRAWAIQNAKEEHDRASAQYAVEQFTQFVQNHPKLIKDESSLQRIIGGMRQTALNVGFTEQEVAGVYDARMLEVLLGKHLYDKGMAVRPQAVVPGKGTTLVPGSARPINGSAGRRNIDKAQLQLERSGRLEDATAVFQRLLR